MGKHQKCETLVVPSILDRGYAIYLHSLETGSFSKERKRQQLF
jgi:hypothetical protein